MAISKLPIDILIEDVKIKDPRLYQILKSLGGLSQTISKSLDTETTARTKSDTIINTTLAAHKDRHKSGGSDAFTSTDLLEAVVKRICESNGVILDIGSINEGQFLKRLGGKIVGDSLIGGGQVGSPGLIGPRGLDAEDPEQPLIIPGKDGKDGLSIIGPPGRDAEDPDDPLVVPGQRGIDGVPGSPGRDGAIFFQDPDEPEYPLLIPGPRGETGTGSEVGNKIFLATNFT